MLDNHQYLYYRTLNFKKKNDQESYDEETKFRTILFIRFFLFYIVLISFLSCLVDLYTMKFFKKITFILIICMIAVVLNLILDSHFLNKNIYLNIMLGLLICFENIIESEIFLPPFIELIQTKLIKSLHFWSIISIGMIMEMKIIILYVSNVKWFLIVLFNIVFHIPMFTHSFYEEGKEKIFLLSGIALIIESLIISTFTSYLKEKSLKEIFLSSKRTQENLSMFEKLIEDYIPAQIIVLNFEKPEIIYTNSKTQEYFQNNYCENSLFTKLKNIKIINHHENFGANLIEIYEKIRKNDFFFFSSENAKYDFKTFEGSCLINENSFIDFNDQANFNYFDIKIGKIAWKNKPAAILIILNDINYKARIKNLVVINDYKDKLLATISHDLRSPLSAINGFFEILKERITDKKCLKLISAGLISAKILFFTINNLLDYSQISSHKLRLNLKEFQIEKILDDVLNIAKYQAKQKGLQFDHTISSSLLKVQLYGDPLRAQQILLNLIGNAIKFTLQGFVKLSIVIEESLDHHYTQKAVFKIIDSGVGIQENNLKNIFDPFFQIDQNVFNLNRTGIGLGLVISQGLAKMMDEEGIKVSSDLEKGSVFEFSIPIARPESIDCLMDEKSNANISKISTYDFEHSFFNKSMKSVNSLNSKQNLNILIVDDDPLNILVHKNYLKIFGLRYETASNGLEALTKIEKLTKLSCFFSLVIMDCNMPFMDGFETAEKIQSLVSNNIIPKIPIVAVTADICLNTIQKCKNSGIQHCLSKPVSKKVLLEKLKEVLRIEI